MTTMSDFRFLLFGLALCLSWGTGSSTSWGQSQFAGVYTGTFHSACDPDDGEFAILVKANNTAVALTFDPLDQEAGHDDGINVNANGSFSHTSVEDGFTTVTNGTFTPTGVSGTYTVNGVCSGTFNGTKLPGKGDLREFGGFYSGNMSGTVRFEGSLVGNFSGDLFMILSANGVSFMTFEGSVSVQGEVEPVEAGVLQRGVRADNLCGSVDLGTINVTCNFNPATLTFTGTFSISASGVAVSGSWTLRRRIALPNSIPVAVNDAYSVKANQTLVVSRAEGVLANDSDADGDTLTAKLAAGTSNGTLALNANGSFTYDPQPHFSGTDVFTYRGTDGFSNSNLATVTITVESATVEAVSAMSWLGLLLLID